MAGSLPSMSMASLAFGGAVVFGGTAYFTNRYAKSHTAVRHDGGPPEPGASFRVFDQIADKYDDAIGQEEAALWYGMMRRWLLHEARGDVLEVSVGTGRNFQYYNLDSNITSLTFTDLSQHMLLRAEDKFFDELQLGHKHPHVRTSFCLADAHCLVDRNAKPEPLGAVQPVAAPPSAPPRGLSTTAAAAAPTPAPNGRLSPPPQEADGDLASAPWWAYWRRLPPSEPTHSSDTAAVRSEGGVLGGSDVPVVAAESLSEDDEKEMPGLHPSGLMNFFRVLVPQSEKRRPHSADAGAPVADNTREAIDLSFPSPVGPESHHACSSSDCGDRTCSYSERCRSGKLESGVPLQRFAPRQFDTVVDTFGLCSHEDPVQALREMARACKPGGKILLLQHGRSYYTWLNNKLDTSADDHQRNWGCLWNRDILALVHEAGLQVDKVTRWHFGTSYYIVARPPASH